MCSNQVVLQGKCCTRFFTYWNFLRLDFISEITFILSVRGKREKSRHSARGRCDLGLLSVVTLQDHRPEVVISLAVCYQQREVMPWLHALQNISSPVVSPLLCTASAVTSAASTETTNDVIFFFFSLDSEWITISALIASLDKMPKMPSLKFRGHWWL